MSFLITYILFSISLLSIIILIRDLVPNKIIYTASTSILLIFIYLCFWVFFLSTLIGQIIVFIFFIYSIIFISIKRKFLFEYLISKEFLTPYILILIIGLIYIALIYNNNSGFNINNNIEYNIANSWHSLPIDNAIPRMFADKLFKDQSPKNILMGLDWTSSDRPPLQACFILFMKPLQTLLPFDNITKSYVSGIIFNLLWIPASWYFLCLFSINNRNKILLIATLSTTPFFLINSLYTWPKLGAAALTIGGMVLLFINHKIDSKTYVISTLLITLAWLSHGGILFTILPFVSYLILSKRFPSFKTCLSCLTIAIILASPWLIYQNFYDPPGNRLIKWHIAGVIDIDDRSFSQTLFDSYKSLSFTDFTNRVKSNLLTIFGNDLTNLHTFRSPSENRHSDFFYFVRPLIIPLIVYFLLTILKFPIHKNKTQLRIINIFSIVSILSLIFWSFIMFIPNSTINHQGSYINNIILQLVTLIILLNSSNKFVCLILLYNIFYLSVNYIL